MCYLLWATQLGACHGKSFYCPTGNHHQWAVPKGLLTTGLGCILLWWLQCRFMSLKIFYFLWDIVPFCLEILSEDVWSIRSIKLSLWGKFSKWCLEFASMSPLNFRGSPAVQATAHGFENVLQYVFTVLPFFFFFNKYRRAAQCTADCSI